MTAGEQRRLRVVAREIKKRTRERGRAIERPSNKFARHDFAPGISGEATMDRFDFRVGEFVVTAEYDAEFGAYTATVTNRNYPIRLTADTPSELKSKFETLLTTYLGAQAA